jgi:hypothetical protein
VTKSETVLHTTVSGALSMTLISRGATDLTSKSSESTSKANLARSPLKVPCPLRDRSARAAGRFCKADDKSDTKSLPPVHVNKCLVAKVFSA